MTYFLISAIGENIQYQHNSSLGISICIESTLQFIVHTNPVALGTFHFRYWLAKSPSTFFHRIGLAKRTCYSGQSKIIKLKYIPWLRSQNFQSFKQFNTYLNKRYGRFCTSTTKKLQASHNGVLTGEELSF